MKLEAPYKCDGPGCIKQKGSTNHWWIVTDASDYFHVEPWEETNPDAAGVKHACSQSCVGKMLDAWLSRPEPAEDKVRMAVSE